MPASTAPVWDEEQFKLNQERALLRAPLGPSETLAHPSLQWIRGSFKGPRADGAASSSIHHGSSTRSMPMRGRGETCAGYTRSSSQVPAARSSRANQKAMIYGKNPKQLPGMCLIHDRSGMIGHRLFSLKLGYSFARLLPPVIQCRLLEGQRTLQTPV